MKIIVLGGAGDVGSRAVEELAITQGVELVTIADRNVRAAEAIAQRLHGSPARVDVRAVDANRHDDLVEVLRGYDVAASALGPFFLFEKKLVRAAIEAGVDYGSVCDEWEAAEAVFEEFDAPARASGRTILTGLGTSPGLSNVGVRYLADQLDRPRRADIYCYQPLNAGGGEAVLRHMLFIMTGDVTIWRNGRRQTLPACSERLSIEFPRFGTLPVWNMGHSEPVTVPRFLPELEEVNFYMGYGRGASLFVWPAQRGWFANRRVTEATVRFCSWLERLTAGEPATGALRIDVTGERDGREQRLTLCGIGGMREATGVSLAIGTLMLARRELCSSEGGVYAPEGCLEPLAFLEHLRAKGIEAFADLAMQQPLQVAGGRQTAPDGPILPRP